MKPKVSCFTAVEELPKSWPGTTTLLGDGSDPSPGPRRLVKTPDAGHPLPKGEGCCPDIEARDVIFELVAES
jgi:hypothetical protein